MERELRVAGIGREETRQGSKRINVWSVYVLVPPDEYIYYVLKTRTKKRKKRDYY